MSAPPSERDYARALDGARAIANSLWPRMTRDELIDYLDWDVADPEQETLWDGLVVHLNTTLVASMAGDQPKWITRRPCDPDKDES